MGITYIRIGHKGVTSAPPVLISVSPCPHATAVCQNWKNTVKLRNLMYGILTVPLLIPSARFARFAVLHVVTQTCNK